MACLRDVLPADRPTRLLALATLINTFGNGLFSTALASSHAFGPLLMIGLPIAFGTPGWIALGLLIASVSVAVVPVSRWGLREQVVAA